MGNSWANTCLPSCPVNRWSRKHETLWAASFTAVFHRAGEKGPVCAWFFRGNLGTSPHLCHGRGKMLPTRQPTLLKLPNPACRRPVTALHTVQMHKANMTGSRYTSDSDPPCTGRAAWRIARLFSQSFALARPPTSQWRWLALRLRSFLSATFVC